MRNLVLTALPRTIELPPINGGNGTTYRVGPPTVQTALEVLLSLPGWAVGEETHTATLEAALKRWLPQALREAVLSDDIDPVWVAERLKGWVWEGVPVPKPVTLITGDGKAYTLTRTGWAARLFDVAHTFQVDPWQVYTQWSFPFFIAAFNDLQALRAKAELSAMKAAAVGHGASGETTLENTLRLAGFETEQQRYENLSDLEKSRRGIAALDAMLGRTTGEA